MNRVEQLRERTETPIGHEIRPYWIFLLHPLKNLIAERNRARPDPELHRYYFAITATQIFYFYLSYPYSSDCGLSFRFRHIFFACFRYTLYLTAVLHCLYNLKFSRSVPKNFIWEWLTVVVILSDQSILFILIKFC